MQTRKTPRLLSLLMALIMAFSLVPFQVLAAETDEHDYADKAMNQVQDQMNFILEYYLGDIEQSAETINDEIDRIAEEDPGLIREIQYEIYLMTESDAYLQLTEEQLEKLYADNPMFLEFVDAVDRNTYPISTLANAGEFTLADGNIYVNWTSSSTNDSHTKSSESQAQITVQRSGTTNITIKNDSDYKAQINFDFALKKTLGSYVGSTTWGEYGSKEFQLEAGETTSVTVTGSSIASSYLKLSNVVFKALVESSQLKISYDDSIGEVSVAGAAVDPGFEDTITSEGAVLKAAPVTNSGATFLAWVNAATNTVISTADEYTLYPEGDVEVVAAFVHPNKTAWFQIGSTLTVGTKVFNDLNAANTYAKTGGYTIIPAASGTLPGGTYQIDSNVKLLIPYGDGDTSGSFGSEPTKYISESEACTMYDNGGMAGRNFAYRTLTVPSGATINCYGQINANGQRQNDGQPYTGVSLGGYGKIALEGKLNMKSGSKLFCYGYITGSGTVELESGSFLYEFLQICDWPGGSNATSWTDKITTSDPLTDAMFPLSQYYIQNVESNLKVNSGAKTYAEAVLKVSLATLTTSSAIVSTSGEGMFLLGDGAYLVREYTPSTDRINYRLYGNVTLGAIRVQKDTLLADIDLNSADHVLPLASNISVTMESGTLSCDKRVALLPDSQLTIAEGATMNLSGTGYIVDVANWSRSYFFNRYGMSQTEDQKAASTFSNSAIDYAPLPYVATLNNISPRANKLVRGYTADSDGSNWTERYYLDVGKCSNSGKLLVNGTLNVTGTIVTTSGTTANKAITGTGVINYTATPATATLRAGYGASSITTANNLINLEAIGNLKPFASGTYYGQSSGLWYNYLVTAVDENGASATDSITVTAGASSANSVTRYNPAAPAIRDTINNVVGYITYSGSTQSTFTFTAADGMNVYKNSVADENKVADSLTGITADTTLVLTAAHVHTFDQENTDAKYLKSAANCQSAAVYYYSCECGEAGIDTFTVGEALGHSYTNYVSDGNATCTADGTKTATCDNGCSTRNTVTDTGSKLAHEYTDYTYNNDATCQKDGTKTASCGYGCGAQSTVTAEGTKTDHVFGDYVSNNDVTCTTAGTKTRTCTFGCGTTETVTDENAPALKHSFTNYISNEDATCLANGTETAKCDRCNVTDTREDADSALGHSFTNYVPNDDAVCGVDGTKTATCDNRCGETHTVTNEGSALKHSFTEYVSNDNATCLQNCTETAYCDHECGVTDTREIAGTKLEHVYTNYVSNNDATCLEDGTETATCDRNCGTTNARTDEGSALGHSFTNYVSDGNATCTTDGTKTAKCDRCDVTDTIADVGSVLGHAYGEYTSNGDATCTADGTKTAECSRCHEKDTVTDEGSKLDHSFTEYVSDNNATCTKDGTETAKCGNCDATDTRIVENSTVDHRYTTYVSNEDATCKADGTKTAECDFDCGSKDTIADEGSKLPHTEVIDAAVDATCTTTGLTEGSHCSVCGEVIVKQEVVEMKDHSYDAVVTAPTCTADGYTTYTCSVCGNSYTGDPVEANGHDYGDGVYTAPTFDADGYTTYTCHCGDSYTVTDEGTQLIAVARIGETRYQTLSEAIADSVEGDEIILLAKATVEGDVRWDLTGKTLTTCDVDGNYSIVVKGSLTITGGTFNVNGVYGIGVQSGASLTIEDGTFTASANSDYLIGSWGSVTISGGEFQGIYSCVNRFDGTVSISGGSFTTEATDSTGEYDSVDVLGDENVTISGGSFSKEVDASHLAEGCCAPEIEGKYVVDEHAYEATVTPPTCTEGGFTTHTCSRCSDTYTDSETPNSGHSYEATVTAPTCTTPGYTTYTCGACGDSYVGDEVPAANHSYSSVVTAPTCVDKGYTTYTCTACGDSYTEEIAASGHKDENGDHYCDVCKTVLDTAIAQIGNKLYGCLDEAVEAAADGATIELLADSTEEVAVSKAVTINKNGFTAVITAGAGYEVSETEDAYVVAVKTAQEEQANKRYVWREAQIGLIEPWFLRINYQFLAGTSVSGGFLDRSEEITEFGFYFLKESDIDEGVDKTKLTAAILKADPDHYVYSSVDGSAFYEHDRLVYSARFRDEIYTYDLSDTLYFCFYYVDSTGRYVTSVSNYNILDLVNGMLTNTSISDYEKAVYEKMSALYTGITDYRNTFEESERTTLEVMTAPIMGESQFADYDTSNLATNIYSFAFDTQILLIEPWGLRLNVHKIVDTTTNKQVNLSEIEDYGMIVLKDTTGSTEAMAKGALLENENTYVFSKSNGHIITEGNSFYARYNKEIFTYQLNTTLHYTYFVKVNGVYYFKSVGNYNIMNLMSSLKETLDTTANKTERQALEANVYGQMVDLYEAITAYRNDYFAKHPEEVQ